MTAKVEISGLTLSKGWTFQSLIDAKMAVTAFCHHAPCNHSQPLDLVKLRDFGRRPVRDSLWGLARCRMPLSSDLVGLRTLERVDHAFALFDEAKCDDEGSVGRRRPRTTGRARKALRRIRQGDGYLRRPRSARPFGRAHLGTVQRGRYRTGGNQATLGFQSSLALEGVQRPSGRGWGWLGVRPPGLTGKRRGSFRRLANYRPPLRRC
ncbi:hypothetical protein D3227_33905 [Mesorhizobium waimense]|uniref:Uncharacterized protein n=1 Tax=Mesorhizobium waimense TaxID=1300307 RepID=A0A3A5K8L2_9HYPH|nr:hypothetical protein D3227_33905 [Mesorhizobium waimense]